MKILAIERELPGAAVGAFSPHLKPEAYRVWELYQAGIIREMYFDPERRQAVLVLECASIVEAGQYLSTLPLVKQGLITFDLV